MNLNRIIVMLVVLITGIFVASTGSFAGKPPKCSPWPECKDDTGGGESGAVAPVVILNSDAIANAATLYWDTPLTEPDGSEVDHYEVRYSETPLNEMNFETAGILFDRPSGIPAYDPGMPEYFSIRGLEYEKYYDIGVRAVDASGNVSSLSDPASFTTVFTRSTADPSPGWQVDTVKELAIDNCCSQTSAQFDSDGKPIVAWAQHHDGPNTSGRIWYGYQDSSGNWETEEAFVAGLCQICYLRSIHDFRTIPVGEPGAETPSIPALLFSHSVAIKGQQWEDVVVYAYRPDDNGWVTEDIVQGGQRKAGEIRGSSAEFSMNYFYDYDDAAWVPTVAYITATEWTDSIVTRGVILARRQEDAGQVTWPSEPMLQCLDPDLDPTSARMDAVRLRRGADGSLHAMVNMSNDSGTWGLIMHRPASNGQWEYRRTGLLETIDFDVDGAGNYYVAGQATEEFYDGRMLILVERFVDTEDTQKCEAPDWPVATYDYDIADNNEIDDLFANGVPEGSIAGSGGERTHGIYLTGDNGITPPAVHIFQSSHIGNGTASEPRVLSRCDPVTGWVRDAVDRIQGHGLNSGNFAVSEDGMAWTYNYGRSRKRHDWKFEGGETVFLGQRTGNACQLVN